MVWILCPGLMWGCLGPNTMSQLFLHSLAERKWANCLSFPHRFKTQQGPDEGKAKGKSLLPQREKSQLCIQSLRPRESCSVQSQEVTHHLLGNMIHLGRGETWFFPKMLIDKNPAHFEMLAYIVLILSAPCLWKATTYCKLVDDLYYCIIKLK